MSSAAIATVVKMMEPNAQYPIAKLFVTITSLLLTQLDFRSFFLRWCCNRFTV